MDKYISIENNCVDYYDYCKKTGINSAKLEENDIVVVPTLCESSYCFEEQTIDFLKHCREKDSEHKYDILFDGEDIPILCKRSFDIWLPILYVASNILLPIVVDVVKEYIRECIKGREKERNNVSVTFVAKIGEQEKSIHYDGPVEQFKESFKKIDLNKMWEK